MDSDYFSVKCLIDGDEKAFEALYCKYHKKIYHTALKMTRSEDLAKDVTQNVFLKIWDTRTRLDPQQNFAAYIGVICRNAVLDIFKKATREENIKRELQQFSEISQSDPEDDDLYETYLNLLDMAITELPQQRRAVFKLCKLQETKYDEVARSMGISRSTVHDHIVKANKFISQYVLTRVKAMKTCFFCI